MRKLSIEEQSKIKRHLDNLGIQFTETFEEVFDHFYSALEQNPKENSNSVFQNLESEFNRETIKSMEETLKKKASKNLSLLQWESLKIWKYNLTELCSFILLMTVSISAAHFFGRYVLLVWIGLIICLCFILMGKLQKSIYRFNIFPWNRGKVSVFGQVLYGRFSFLAGMGIASLLNLKNVTFKPNISESEVLTLPVLFLLICLFYTFSILKILLREQKNTSEKDETLQRPN